MSAPRRAIIVYKNNKYLVDIDVINKNFIEGKYKANYSFIPFFTNWSDWFGVGCFYMDQVTSIKFV